MLSSSPSKIRLPAIAILLLGSLLLGGCETSPDLPPPPDETALAPTDPAERLLWQASRSTGEQKVDYLIQAMALFLNDGDLANALRVEQSVTQAPLSPNQEFDFRLLAAELALNFNQVAKARQLLEPGPAAIFQQLPLEDEIRYATVSAKALQQGGENIEAARTLFDMSGLLTGEQYQLNQDAIWHNLREAQPNRLAESAAAESDILWLGWLQLAEQMSSYQFSLDQQLSALQTWQSTNPDHPATLAPPAELQMLMQLPSSRPKKIALLLPLSGSLAKVGESVRDGFLAAYYQDQNFTGSQTEINVFDTSAYDSIIDLYLQLQIQSYDLIIGPLEKKQVESLTRLPQLSPPVLALNYVESSQIPPSGLFQFGVSAEDEISQIVQHLRQQEQYNLAIIAPEALWAQELVAKLKDDVFRNSLPEPVIYTYSQDMSLSDGISGMLDIDQSKQRYYDLRNLLGKLEFEPRRRGDLDAVILVAPPVIARQVKPLLAFHYASDLPVFASSQVYSGFPQPEQNHDLNGIVFTETPWLLLKNNPLREDIQYLAGLNRYERLYAMGADAYTLAPRLKLLSSFPDSTVFGFTGALRLNPEGQLRRELQWATFRRGLVERASPLPTTSE